MNYLLVVVTAVCLLLVRAGGSFLASVLITFQPPGWTMRGGSLNGLVVGWYMVFCLPGDVLWRVWHSFPMQVRGCGCWLVLVAVVVAVAVAVWLWP